MKRPLILDFETKAIGPRPQHYPPEPVSFAYKLDSDRGFLSWGHHSGNNSTHEKAYRKLKGLYAKADCVVAHNAGFDREVSEVHMHLDRDIPWYDTMVMAFLRNPYGQLGLKPLGENVLGMPPEERDAVRDWLVRNGVVKATQKDWGAYISHAPGDVVEPYALGDVDRAEGLFRTLLPQVNIDAVNRERLVTPVVIDMERHGVRLDMPALERDTNDAFQALEALDKAIRKKLGDVDMDNDAQIAAALEAKNKLKQPLPLTEGGATSVNKRALIECVKDKQLLGDMLLRNSLATCVRTFMHPWLQQGRMNGGRMYFRFNQVRGEGVGAKTGRMSSSPNMMNVPSNWEMLNSVFKAIGYTPKFPLPNLRKYILPDEGHALIALDYSQQEMRLFAHFEDGALMRAYQKDPRIDAHAMVAEISGLSRKVAKTLNFAALYGAGLSVVMQWLDCTYEEASDFRRQYRAALPGVKDLNDSIMAELRAGRPIETIGGRQYYAEPPKYIKGQMRSFEYKLMNYLMQGSAADQTKEAMIAYHYSPKRRGRLMFTVHDELVISAPKQHAAAEGQLLRKCMEQAFARDLDVKFLVDMEIGANYGEV